MKRVSSCFAVAIVALLQMIGSASADDALPQVRTVALTGTQAPGAPEGVQLSSFPIVRPVVNELGEVAFTALLSDPINGTVVPYVNDAGIWSEGGGGLHLVARAGDEAPGVSLYGGPAAFCLIRHELYINEAGTTGFRSHYRPVDSGSCNLESGLWRETAGLLTNSVASHDPAPGVDPESRFQGILQWPAFNDGEEFGFAAISYDTSTGASSGYGVWATQNGEILPLAVPGMLVPDNGTVVLGAGLPVVLNDDHAAAFRGGVDPGSGERYAVMRSDADGIHIIAMVGEAVPGINGETFTYLSELVAINNHGTVLFKGFTSNGLQGIWSAESDNGSAELQFKTGDPAPGTVSGNFSGFYEPVINANGQIAFEGFLGSERGIWVGPPESLQLAALSGDAAPGADEGEVFCTFSPRMAINNDGEAAFIAGFCLPGGVFPTGVGLWGWNPVDGLVPIAVSGKPLNNAEFETPPVASVFAAFSNLTTGGGGAYTSSGNEDGQPSALSDSGKLAFAVQFTDGSSGVFMAELRADDPALLLQALIDEVYEADLGRSITKQLLKKLEGALTKVADDEPKNDHVATNQLEAFIAIVESKSGKQLPTEVAESWIADAQQVIDLLLGATD